MRLILIDANHKSYTVYEGRRLMAQYAALELLDAQEVEDLRQNPPYLAQDQPGPDRA